MHSPYLTQLFPVYNGMLLFQVVLENSGRANDQDCPFVQASIQLTSDLCEILKIGEDCKCLNLELVEAPVLGP